MKLFNLPLYVSMPKDMEKEYAHANRIRFVPFLRATLLGAVFLEVMEVLQDYILLGLVMFPMSHILLTAFYLALFGISLLPGVVRYIHLIGVIGVTGVIFSFAVLVSYSTKGLEFHLAAFFIPLQLAPLMTSFTASFATIWLAVSIILNFAGHSNLTYYALHNIKNILMWYSCIAVVISYVGTQYRRASFVLEKKLERARQEAEEANAAKSIFLATMSHEVRTPLNGILGLVELMMDRPMDQTQRDYAETVKYSGEALLTIVNDILDFSKMETGKLEIEAIDFDLNRLLGSVVNLMNSRAREKGLRLDYTIGPDVPLSIKSDPTRIRQVLLNLIGNAIKFTHAGSVHITVSFGAGRQGDTILEFEVFDTGIGIPPEAGKKLFQEFVQADSSTARQYGGTGLGLAICKKIVELMHGEISFTSDPGKGTTFRFAVPVHINELKTIEETAAPVAMNSLPAFRPLHILVAEDNEVNQKVIAGLLKRTGLQTTAASNGEEALQMLQDPAASFDLVLMDMQMPVMDGLTAAAAIRMMKNGKASIPIIALTANHTKEDEQSCLAAGMNGFISKPINPAALYNVIASHVPHSTVESFQSSPNSQPPNFESLINIEDVMGRDYMVQFVEESLPSIESLLEAMTNANDINLLKHNVHDLKNLSRMFGLDNVHSVAGGIELCCDENSFADAARLCGLLHSRYQNDVAVLRRHYIPSKTA